MGSSLSEAFSSILVRLVLCFVLFSVKEIKHHNKLHKPIYICDWACKIDHLRAKNC